MDLAYSAEYEAFRAELRGFLEANKARYPQSYGEGRPNAETLAWQKLLIEHGYAARTIPREYGGYGAEPDILKSRIIAEEFTRAGAPGPLANQGISMLVPTLLELGTEEQKREFIAPTLRGDIIWCQGYSEPGAGSDLASLQTRAIRRRARLHHQWPEDLDLDRPACRHDLLPGAHRKRQSQTSGHFLSDLLDDNAGHRGAAPAHHDQPCRIQRGVLYGCAGAQAPDRRRTRTGLVRRQCHAQA